MLNVGGFLLEISEGNQRAVEVFVIQLFHKNSERSLMYQGVAVILAETSCFYIIEKKEPILARHSRIVPA